MPSVPVRNLFRLFLSYRQVNVLEDLILEYARVALHSVTSGAELMNSRRSSGSVASVSTSASSADPSCSSRRRASAPPPASREQPPLPSQPANRRARLSAPPCPAVAASREDSDEIQANAAHLPRPATPSPLAASLRSPRGACTPERRIARWRPRTAGASPP